MHTSCSKEFNPTYLYITPVLPLNNPYIIYPLYYPYINPEGSMDGPAYPSGAAEAPKKPCSQAAVSEHELGNAKKLLTLNHPKSTNPKPER